MNLLRQGCAMVIGLLISLAAARGQYSFTDQNSVLSVSGQFLVSGIPDDTPAYRKPNFPANTNLIRVKTALLAVGAERFKISLWQQLGIAPNASWSGKIFLRVHPARSLNETVTITASPFLNHWNYGVELPDTLWKMRYARALSGVLLLEFANRSARPGGHSAEIPPWLVDGLAQQVIGADGEKVLLSAPLKKGDDLAVGRVNQADHDFDPLTSARQILQSLPVLTFDQLSWPTDEQMNGADGGAYLASAQLFQFELLGLKNGKEKMRALLAALPNHFNWQTAFFKAFGEDFKRPLDMEKWWALRIVNFASRAPGPRWTTDVSLVRLQSLLSVPVEYRSASNALPTHAEISLQAALKNLGPEQRDTVVRTKVRDLGLVELRLAPPFGDLADRYRVALGDFLGEYKRPEKMSVTGKRMAPARYQASVAETVAKLDALDRRRREAEAKAVIPLPKFPGR